MEGFCFAKFPLHIAFTAEPTTNLVCLPISLLLANCGWWLVQTICLTYWFGSFRIYMTDIFVTFRKEVSLLQTLWDASHFVPVLKIL